MKKGPKKPDRSEQARKASKKTHEGKEAGAVRTAKGSRRRCSRGRRPLKRSSSESSVAKGLAKEGAAGTQQLRKVSGTGGPRPELDGPGCHNAPWQMNSPSTRPPPRNPKEEGDRKKRVSEAELQGIAQAPVPLCKLGAR